MNASTRNRCIDTIKGVACIFVVLIHYNWSNDISTVIKSIGRFAVPFFFFVSGYYLPNKTGKITTENLHRKIKHIFSLAIKSAIFYWIFCIYWNSVMDAQWNVWTFTKAELTRESVMKFLLSSDPFVYAHFWYIIALLACYLTVYLIRDKVHASVYGISFAILLVCYSIFAEFKDIFGVRNYISLSDNAGLVISNMFIFRALPYLLLGIYLKKRQPQCKVNLYILAIIALAGCMLTVLEDKRFGTILMYTGSHITVLSLSVMSISYPQKSMPVFEFIGNKLSMYVYIYHIAVGKVFDLLAAKLHLWGNSSFKVLRPIYVVAFSLLLAEILVSLHGLLITRKKKSI